MTDHRPTIKFLDEVMFQAYESVEAGAANTLRTLLTDVQARNTHRIAGLSTDQVLLTGDEWASLEKFVRIQLGCITAEH